MRHRNKPAKNRPTCKVKLMTLFVTLTIALLWVAFHQKQIREQEEKKVIQVISDIIVIEAQKSQQIDHWWMRTQLPATAETMTLLENKKNEVLSKLHKYRSISAETESLVSRFNSFIPGAYVNGGFRFLNEHDSQPSYPTNSIGFFFVPEEMMRESLYYCPTWNSGINGIAMAALEMPEQLEVAILFHELGHAKRHNKIDGKPDSDAQSAERIQEEVEMTEFSGEILNQISHGAYHKYINEIIKRELKKNRFEQVIASITSDDCAVFNAMFGCSGEVPSKLLMVNCVYILGFRFCETRGKSMKEKIEVYNWFETNIK
ncbi:MAG TPA: hypothetical protein VK675_02690 [Candidatus Paceibacterota bacterium]|nr:hypothetical protein [Candidatus Paceibacterota bacterium]